MVRVDAGSKTEMRIVRQITLEANLGGDFDALRSITCMYWIKYGDVT